jgi:hypothetical protein
MLSACHAARDAHSAHVLERVTAFRVVEAGDEPEVFLQGEEGVGQKTLHPLAQGQSRIQAAKRLSRRR